MVVGYIGPLLGHNSFITQNTRLAKVIGIIKNNPARVLISNGLQYEKQSKDV